jgi:hypothetical protein
MNWKGSGKKWLWLDLGYNLLEQGVFFFLRAVVMFSSVLGLFRIEEKIRALYIQIARQAVQSSSEFYDFFCSFIAFISAFSQI